MAISSKRNRLDVETDLKVGDIVRVGDQSWYDSLPEYTGEFQYLSNGVEKWPNKDRSTVFTEDMKRYLGKRVMIVDVIYYDDDGPNYTVQGADDELPEIKQFIFTNDMLFYD